MRSTLRYQPASSTRSSTVGKVWLLGVLVFSGWAACKTNSNGFLDPTAPKGGRVDGAAGVAGQSGSTLPTGDTDAGNPVDVEGTLDGSPQSTDGSLVRDGGGLTDATGPGGKQDVGGAGGQSDAAGAGGTRQNVDAGPVAIDAPMAGSTDAGGTNPGGGTGGASGGSRADTGGAIGGATGSTTGGSTGAPADAGISPDTQIPLDTSQANAGDASAWHVVWSDEFNRDRNARIDQSKWNVETWDPGTVNNEEQKYVDSPKNVFFDGEGHLVLRGLHDASNAFPYTSARIQTDGNFAFKFGRIEIRAKLPAGKGSFPGMILMGSNGAAWPQCGEIALMEQYGNDKSSIYCSTYSSSQNDLNEKITPQGASFSDEFHIFALEWYGDHMVFFVDDAEVARRSFGATSPFANANNDFYIILDVALGGNMGGKIDNAAFPMDMVLDYVRVSTL